MTENVVRFCDFDKRSKQPAAAQPRDPCEADIIAFPIIPFPRADRPEVPADEHQSEIR
jgi:hypothetical protein